MNFDEYIIAPHTAACIADESSCTHGDVETRDLAVRVLALRSQLDELLDEVFEYVEDDEHDQPAWRAIMSHLSHAREFAANAGWALDDLAEGREVILETLAPHPNVLGPGLA